MAPNVPALLEAHYAVPALGAVLNPINVRLDAATVAFCLEHGQARVLLADAEFAPVVKAALALVSRPLVVVDIDDPEGPPGERLGAVRYEDLLAEGDPAFAWPGPQRRVGRAGAALHVGDDGRSQGRRLPPSRRVPQRAGQRARVPALSRQRVPVDAADVPLLRLDLHVGGHRGRRHARLPAARRSRAHLSGDPRPPRHAHVRRADRAQPAGARAGARQARLRPRGRRRDRWRGAAVGRHRGDGGDGLPRHAPVRADRIATDPRRCARGRTTGRRCR